MESILREKLLQLTAKSESLAKTGKFIECIDICQEVLGLKKQLYGLDHPEFQRSSEKLCEYLNLAAMMHLQKEQFEESLDLLRKAELVARNSWQFKSLTYNNLACYYRRTGKIRTALAYLIQALELQLKLDEPKTLADTHLNLCAVLSQLDRHEDALQHVMLSIILLQDEFLSVTLSQLQSPIADDRLAVMAIAYHNLGVEFQHLKRFEQAGKIYKKALKIAEDHLKDNQQLIDNLTKVVNSATSQIQIQKKQLVDAKRQKYERQFSVNKKQIYKEFTRVSDKLKNLPKLQIKRESMQGNDYRLNASQGQPILEGGTANSRFGDRNLSKQKQDERRFVSRKHPRYYKSYAMTPSAEQSSRGERTQLTKQIEVNRIPVSSGLQEFQEEIES